MFDDCNVACFQSRQLLLITQVVVEHTAPTPGHSRSTVPLPQVQYEGFEPSPYASDIHVDLEHTAALVGNSHETP